jgi:hypothetical protein
MSDRQWTVAVPSGAVCAHGPNCVLSSSEHQQRLMDVASGTSGSTKNIAKGAGLGVAVGAPMFDEKVAFAQVLSDMDTGLAALEARRNKIRQLKPGKTQALLTDRIRLA